jgi:hypothetical protein
MICVMKGQEIVQETNLVIGCEIETREQIRINYKWKY